MGDDVGPRGGRQPAGIEIDVDDVLAAVVAKPAAAVEQLDAGIGRRLERLATQASKDPAPADFRMDSIRWSGRMRCSAPTTGALEAGMSRWYPQPCGGEHRRIGREFGTRASYDVVAFAHGA